MSSGTADGARTFQQPGWIANRPRPSGTSQGGSITAEFAVALPAVVLVLALMLGAAQWGFAQLAAVDAARMGARAVARGDPVPRGEQNCSLGSVAAGEGMVTVTARCPVSGPLGAALGGSASWTATARMEETDP